MNINRLLHAYVEPEKCYHERESNPDYSTPVHFKKLTDKLFGDIPLYYKFEGWLFHKKYKQSHVNEIGLVDTRLFIPWLFSDYSRFCTLFAEFLQLPETVKEFGWEECECKGEPIRGDKLVWCLKCNGTGKILKPWAKVVKEDEDV